MHCFQKWRAKIILENGGLHADLKKMSDAMFYFFLMCGAILGMVVCIYISANSRNK
jgi:hypothetical protein